MEPLSSRIDVQIVSARTQAIQSRVSAIQRAANRLSRAQMSPRHRRISQQLLPSMLAASGGSGSERTATMYFSSEEGCESLPHSGAQQSRQISLCKSEILKRRSARTQTRMNRQSTIRRQLSAPTLVPKADLWGETAAAIMANSSFRWTMGACIVMNAAIIGLETDHPSACWEFAELVFLVMFMIELILRLRILGIVRYFQMKDNPDFLWNVFDACLVVFGVTGTLLEHLHLIVYKEGVNLGFSTVLRVFRLLRVLRILKLVRMVKQLYMLIFGFGIAALATFWLTILFTAVLYLVAVVSVRLRLEVPDSDTEATRFLNERFQTVRAAMSSLFQLMIQPDLTSYEELLSESKLFSALITLWVTFGKFGMSALLTGVITEAMFEKNTMRLQEDATEREQRRAVLNRLCGSVFDMLDKQQNQTQIGRARRVSAIRKAFETHELSLGTLQSNMSSMMGAFEKEGFVFARHDLQEVLTWADRDHIGRLSKRQFANAICSISEAAVQASTVLELHKGIAKRAADAEKEMSCMHEMTIDRGQTIQSNLEQICEIQKNLENKLNKALTLTMVHADIGVCNSQQAGQVSDQRSHNFTDSTTSQPSRWSVCQPCLRECGNVAEATKVALQFDAFEPVLGQMQNSVNKLLVSEKAKNDMQAKDNMQTLSDCRGMLLEIPSSRYSEEFPNTARFSETWNGANFEVPVDTLDEAIESLESTDLF